MAISMRSSESPRWHVRVVKTHADGSFAATWAIRGRAYFVAQWAGDAVTAGAGTGVVAAG